MILLESYIAFTGPILYHFSNLVWLFKSLCCSRTNVAQGLLNKVLDPWAGMKPLG